MKRLLRVLAASLVVTCLTVTPAAAASCKGNSHQPALTNGASTPGSAPFGSPITFSVRYADTAGCVPSMVSVTVDGVGTFTMSTADTDLVAGVTYTWVATLPVGSYSYRFSATSGQGGGQKTVDLSTVAPTRVVVTQPPPPPTPAPTPVPTPRPTSPPPPPPPASTAPPPPATTPGGGAAPAPAQGSGGATPAAPTAAGSPSPSVAPTATPAASPTTGAAPPASDDPSTSPSPEPSSDAVGAPVGGAHPDEPTDGGTTGEAPDGPPLALGGIALVGALGGVALWLVAGRRRRRETPDGVQPGLAATLLTDTAGDEPPTVTPLPPMRELVPPPVNLVMLDEGSDRVEPPPDEVDMPRWLRPSLRQARQGPSTYRRWDD